MQAHAVQLDDATDGRVGALCAPRALVNESGGGERCCGAEGQGSRLHLRVCDKSLVDDAPLKEFLCQVPLRAW
jgi:hypothetical protein